MINDNIQLSIESLIEWVNKATTIRIIGSNPLIDVLTSPKFVIALRKRIENLHKENHKEIPFFTLYMESEQEDFFQQLTDKEGAVHYKETYKDKKVKIFGNEQANYKSALVAEMSNQITTIADMIGTAVNQELLEFLDKNIIVLQLNLRMPFNAINVITDNYQNIWFSPLGLNVLNIKDYIYLDEKHNIGYKSLYLEIVKYFDYLETDDIDSEKKGFRFEMGGKKFTSRPDSELIEAYDKESNKRVAVFDRKAFLTLEYKRASIWGFVFNRKGQLLLHQRSLSTADNRAMWDKSTGGHVDLTDASTAETAKREFVEEIYMDDSEQRGYTRAKTEMVVDFGEWRRSLRADDSFLAAFKPFIGKDRHVIMFRAFTAGSETALTVDRDSIREIIEKDKNGKEVKVNKPTRFRSDVFFYIAAEGAIDNEIQMKKTLNLIEQSKEGASMSHKLMTIAELERDVLKSVKGESNNKYTDDMIHIIKNYAGYLTEFSSFVKSTFERIGQIKRD